MSFEQSGSFNMTFGKMVVFSEINHDSLVVDALRLRALMTLSVEMFSRDLSLFIGVKNSGPSPSSSSDRGESRAFL